MCEVLYLTYAKLERIGILYWKQCRNTSRLSKPYYYLNSVLLLNLGNNISLAVEQLNPDLDKLRWMKTYSNSFITGFKGFSFKFFLTAMELNLSMWLSLQVDTVIRSILTPWNNYPLLSKLVLMTEFTGWCNDWVYFNTT